MEITLEPEEPRCGSLAKISEGLTRIIINPDEPASPHYYSALLILDWLESVHAREMDWWLSQLDSARRSLESAWYEEGGIRPAISAYIQTEMGRIEYLAGNSEQAERLLSQAKENFEAAGLDDKAARIEDELTCMGALRR